MNNDVQDGKIISTVNVKFIGPPLGPGVEKDENTGKNISGVQSSEYSGTDNYDDYGSTWVNESIARSIWNRRKGLPHDEVEGYNLDDLVATTVGEESTPPPELFEPDRNSAAGIDPASDTGQALSGNCSSRKTVGQVLSKSMVIDGTAGSEYNFERDFSGVKALLRLNGEPAQQFGEDYDAARLRLCQVMSRIRDTSLPDNHAGSGFTPSSPSGDDVGVDNRSPSQDVESSSG